eukprot:9597209-Ditylum_brightwellii.AAC.1
MEGDHKGDLIWKPYMSQLRYTDPKTRAKTGDRPDYMYFSAKIGDSDLANTKSYTDRGKYG